MIQIISGTNRPGSNTRKVTEAVFKNYQALGVPSEVLDLTLIPLEIYQGSSYAEKPAAFVPWAKKILAADKLVIVTPEYNGGFPGALKYFIDMLEFPTSFVGKPICLVGLAAGMWGALRPVEQLQTLCLNLGAHVFPEKVLIPQINQSLTDAGELKEGPVSERLLKQAVGFNQYKP